MIYFLRRQIDSNLKVGSVLFDVFGLNLTRISFICRRVGIKSSVKFKELSLFKIRELDKFITKIFLIDRGLLRTHRVVLSEFLKTANYRALRMRQGLPAHGQRTHTNAGTARRMRDVRERELKKKV